MGRGNDDFIKQFIGQKFGRLTVVSFLGRVKSHAKYDCLCDCGNHIIVDRQGLRRSYTRSCGCLHRDATIKRSTRHGMYRTPEYESWHSMIQRCHTPTCTAYPLYGGRGIRVCKRWRDSFKNFYADMGPRPFSTSLDRIDNNGNYCPGNCRWATHKEQCNNTRRNRKITHDGQTLSITQWEVQLGFSRNTIFGRLALGWAIHDALTKPVLPHRARKQ